jgi:hypothetical protein
MRREFAAETTTGPVQIGHLAAATRSRRSPSFTTLLRSRRRGSGWVATSRGPTCQRVSGTLRTLRHRHRPLTNIPASGPRYCPFHHINHLLVGHASLRPHLLCLWQYILCTVTTIALPCRPHSTSRAHEFLPGSGSFPSPRRRRSHLAGDGELRRNLRPALRLRQAGEPPTRGARPRPAPLRLPSCRRLVGPQQGRKLRIASSSRHMWAEQIFDAFLFNPPVAAVGAGRRRLVGPQLRRPFAAW